MTKKQQEILSLEKALSLFFYHITNEDAIVTSSPFLSAFTNIGWFAW